MVGRSKQVMVCMCFVMVGLVLGLTGSALATPPEDVPFWKDILNRLDIIQSEVENSQKVVLRKYYLTPEAAYDGASALQACATGYHMASLWEIFDTSNLEYDTDRGLMRDDSGSGPPAGNGWVRTGETAQSGDGPGEANCNAWTSNDGDFQGSSVGLNASWERGDLSDQIQPWITFDPSCATMNEVWCVEDLHVTP